MIAVEGLTVSYRRGRERVRALHDVSLRIERGETYGLAGESGSGKTTLALALLRQLPPGARVESGRVLLDGVDLLAGGRRSVGRWRGSRVALVPQGAGGALNPALRVGTQLGEVFRVHAGMLPAEAAEAAARALAEVRVGDPARMLERYPHELSAGQQQRALIAMALAARPDVLLLDEPTTALDATVEAEVLELVASLQAELDAAILLVSHDVRVVARLCDRAGLLYAGRLVEEGPAAGTIESPRHPYTLGLVRSAPRLSASGPALRLEPIPGRAPGPGEEPAGCAFAPRCALARPRCREEPPPLYAAGDARVSRCHYHDEVPSLAPPAPVPAPARPAAGEALLRVRGLSHRFGALEALHEVSLDVRAGEVLGLVGESGSGKSTLARCLAGLLPPDAGSLELRGEPLPWRLRRRPEAARRAIQLVFQDADAALNPALAAATTLRRSLRRLDGKAGVDRALAELAAGVRLSPAELALRPAALSGGTKQRVSLARALAGSPALLVCDEPVSDLDVSVQAAILNLFAELRAERGVSFLFISHDLAVVRHLADRVGVLYLGELVELAATQRLFEPPSHPYTEALVSAAAALEPGEERPRITLRRLPSAVAPPDGCRFHPRCPRFLGEVCATVTPPWQHAPGGHAYRCHIPPRELAGLQRADRIAGRAPAPPPSATVAAWSASS